MFAWVLLKRAAFCKNNCENVGIILRIIGEFKKEFPERIIGEFKSIIDLSLVLTSAAHLKYFHKASHFTHHVYMLNKKSRTGIYRKLQGYLISRFNKYP